VIVVVERALQLIAGAAGPGGSDTERLPRRARRIVRGAVPAPGRLLLAGVAALA
jgi:hypothetical protein